MMELFKLLGTIAINNSEAKEALEETTDHAKETGEELEDTADKAKQSEKGMVNAFKNIGKAIVTYISVDAIKNFGLSCINAAADVGAMESQFSQVFGELESNASSSLSKIADEAGISENRMKGSFTKIAAFAKTTGMDTESALSLSERAMIAVADSAAFYDRSLKETTESLQSFLKGNYENDSALGLSCTETTRNAAANELYGKSFKDLSESQKQLTLLKMVEEANKTSGALGQAARESDTWTNQTGNLKQAWTDFEAIIGATFLPAIIEFVKSLSEVLQVASEKFIEFKQWCSENETVLSILAIVVGTLTFAIAAYNIAMNASTIAIGAYTAAMWIANTASTAFGAVMSFITSPITLVVLAIGALIAIGVALYQNWDVVKEKALELWDKLTETFDNIKVSISNSIENAINNVKTTISAGLNSAKSTVSSVLSSIKEKFTSIFESVKSTVKNAIDKVKDMFNFTWSLPKIELPHFKVSGGEAPWGFGGKGSLPTVSVEWYAKAMNNPMVLDKPTIFGYNAESGQYMGGGEAGTEVVSGANTLMNMIAQAVAGQNSELVSVLYKILEAILALDENMGGNLREALVGTSFEVNHREFARLVKAVN